MQLAIPYMQFRGGSSKGLYFLAEDLPEDSQRRDQMLLDAMGRDALQIDGLGGANPLTSKIAIVSRSTRSDADVDFLFGQIVPGQSSIDFSPNCGNILTGVGPFALESGLIKAEDGTTQTRVHMVNTGKLCDIEVSTPDGEVTYEGDTTIDGVPGRASPVVCSYLELAGSSCGALLPTGQITDVVDGITLTAVDNGMPVVVIRAQDVGISGSESAAELNQDLELKTQLESIRLQIGPAMNLGGVSDKAVPKMCLVSAARHGGLINTRTFIPHTCHETVGVLGAVSAATACVLNSEVTRGIACPPEGRLKSMSIEHPQGAFPITLEVDESGEYPSFISARVTRTARLLSKGMLFVPSKSTEDC